MRVRAWASRVFAEVDMVLEYVVEFFTLHAAEQKASSIGEPRRALLRAEFEEAVLRCDSADALLRAGATSDARRALDESVARFDSFAPELGLAGERPAAEDLAADLRAQRDALADAAPLLWLPRERKRARILRGISAALVVVAAFGAWLSWRFRDRVYVRASAYTDWEHRPTRMLDGKETTDWRLPEKTNNGWVELMLVPPRRVTTVAILNGYDPPEYGLLDFRIEGLSKGNIVKSHDATFVGQAAHPRPIMSPVPFDTVQDVDTIRLVIKTHRPKGASIAEISVR